MSFTTVFDAANVGYSTWWFPAFGLIFVGLGVLLVFRPALMMKFAPSGLQGRARRIFSWFYLIFSVCWTLISFINAYGQRQAVATKLQEGHYNVIEGPVTDFVPMPYAGHSEESFVVGDKRFSYSDYILTSGFHKTTSHGGPIRLGLYVRVTYVDNLILKLEVAR